MHKISFAQQHTQGIENSTFALHPIQPGDLNAVLEVYRQCEDFLALGPVATASMKMVEADIELSHQAGGTFCGIFTSEGQMIGVVDYILMNFEGEPHYAHVSLLMIIPPFRKLGIGRAVVERVEAEIQKNPEVTAILSGVQVNNPLAVKFWQRQGYRLISGPERMPDQTTVFHLQKDINWESNRRRHQ